MESVNLVGVYQKQRKKWANLHLFIYHVYLSTNDRNYPLNVCYPDHFKLLTNTEKINEYDQFLMLKCGDCLQIPYIYFISFFMVCT